MYIYPHRILNNQSIQKSSTLDEQLAFLKTTQDLRVYDNTRLTQPSPHQHPQHSELLGVLDYVHVYVLEYQDTRVRTRVLEYHWYATDGDERVPNAAHTAMPAGLPIVRVAHIVRRRLPAVPLIGELCAFSVRFVFA